MRLILHDLSWQTPSRRPLWVSCYRLSSVGNPFTHQRLQKELTISEQQGPVFLDHHFITRAEEPLSSPRYKGKIPSNNFCFTMSLSSRHHREINNMISESKGASSRGKINKPEVPQLPFLHWAEQSREQEAPKHKQILTASRFAAPLQVHENVHPEEPQHTQNYFQAITTQSEHSLASIPPFSVDASHSLVSARAGSIS